MAIIKVDTEGIASLRQSVVALQNEMVSALNYIAYAKQNIDINTASSESVSTRLNSLQRRLTAQHNKLKKYETALTAVNEKFLAADKSIARESKNVSYLLDKISTSTSNLNMTRNSLKIQSELEDVETTLNLFGSATGALLASSSLALTGVLASIDETDSNRVWGLDYSNSTDDMSLGVLNYSSDDNNFEGSLFNFSNKSNVGDFSSQEASVSVGAVSATAGTSFSLFGLGRSKNEKEGFKYSSQDGLAEYDGSSNSKTSVDILDVGVKAEVGISVLDMDYKQHLGTEEVNFEVGSDIKLLTADAGIDFGVKYGEDGFEGEIGAAAGASLAEVSASGGINLGDAEIKTTVSAEIGIGLSASVKYTAEEGFEVSLGAALGIGGKIKFKIKFW